MGFGTNGKLKGWFNWVARLFFLSFIQTIIFLLIIFVLERSGLFFLVVRDMDEKIIYPYEAGGFFFGLLLISDISVEIFRYFITEKKKIKKIEKYKTKYKTIKKQIKW